MAYDSIYEPLRRFPAMDIGKLKMARVMMRAMQAAHPKKTSPDVEIEDQLVARAGRSIPIRLYRPRNVEKAGVLLFFHGGGFIVGNLDTEHARCVDYAALGKCAVVSVDYRLAPEDPFPAAHDDGWEILNWLREGGAGDKIDPTRIGVGGGSAGATLAAGLALRDRDEGSASISFVLLMQPVVDHLCSQPSAQTFTDTLFLRAGDLPVSWRAYLGKTPPTGPLLSYASPFAASDFRGLAPTLAIIGAEDPSRDEALALASRMMADDVDVELHFFPGAPHGFEMVEAAPATQTSLALRASALIRALARA